MNSDIYDELEMSTDHIMFDREMRLQEESRAAKTIQRWYKDRKNLQLERQAREAQQMLKLKKQKLYQMYIEGRDSLMLDDLANPLMAFKNTFNAGQTGSIYVAPVEGSNNYQHPIYGEVRAA
jgi:hypothetical protein